MLLEVYKRNNIVTRQCLSRHVDFTTITVVWLFVIFRSLPKLVTTWISFSFDMEIGIPRFHQISKTRKLYELYKSIISVFFTLFFTYVHALDI